MYIRSKKNYEMAEEGKSEREIDRKKEKEWKNDKKFLEDWKKYVYFSIWDQSFV